jgi:hypothetical protein
MLMDNHDPHCCCMNFFQHFHRKSFSISSVGCRPIYSSNRRWRGNLSCTWCSRHVYFTVISSKLYCRFYNFFLLSSQKLGFQFVWGDLSIICDVVIALAMTYFVRIWFWNTDTIRGTVVAQRRWMLAINPHSFGETRSFGSGNGYSHWYVIQKPAWMTSLGLTTDAYPRQC